MPQPSTRLGGFTLVELAIVLVIIGLVVGGVLMGQDMIKGAEVRATVGQFEKYNAAVNTFRDKYRLLAGDVALGKAAQFGLAVRPAGSGGVGQYDGNGKVEACAAAATIVGCENVAFWEDLNAAGLLDSTYTQTLTLVAPTWSASSGIGLYLPPSRLGQGIYITAYASGGSHFYQIGGLTVAGGALTLNRAISPIQAYNMDQKLDDGRPRTGSAVAAVSTGTAFNNLTAATLGTDGCIEATTLLYRTDDRALADTPACALRVRFN